MPLRQSNRIWPPLLQYIDLNNGTTQVASSVVTICKFWMGGDVEVCVFIFVFLFVYLCLVTQCLILKTRKICSNGCFSD